MTIDAQWAKAGLKSMSKLHTSTFVDAHLNINNGKVIKAQVNMPKDTIDVIDVTVDYLSMDDTGSYQPLISSSDPVRFNGCTSNTFSQLFGVQLCGSALYFDNPKDNLDLVFAGPFSLKIDLSKTDSFDAYTFDYSWINDDQETKIMAILDTPGSRINRRSSLNMLFNSLNWDHLALSLEIPVKQIDIDVIYQWKSQGKLLKASLSMENQLIASLHNSLKQVDNGKYEAQIKANYKQMELILWKGSFMSSSNKLDLTTQLKSHFLMKPMTARATVVSSNDRWDIDGQVASDWIQANINGLFQQTDTSFNIKSDLGYTFKGQQEETVGLQCSYKLNNIGDLNKHIFFVLVDVSFHTMSF